MHRDTKTIFLDHHATTPVDPEVVEAMLPYFSTHFGNPSGTETASGRRAAEAVSTAREQVAELLNAEPAEIIFTSGATEANNLAILGTLAALQERTPRRTVLTTPVEHKTVLGPFEIIARRSFRVVMLPVTSTGRVDLEPARALFNEDSLLLSVQLASNEIGTIQPLPELISLAHEYGALVHTDAAQAAGKVPIDIVSLGVDLLSLSAHKFNGPKGVGALYLRNGPRSFPIEPRLIGGAQEQGLRAGTINVPGVVGLGVAATLAKNDLGRLPTRLAWMRDAFENALLGFDSTLTRNGDLVHRLPNNSSITFCGIEAQVLIQHLPELELSSGAACTSGAPEPSHVLQAIGLSREDAYSTLRFGWGRTNTLNDSIKAADQIQRAVTALRKT